MSVEYLDIADYVAIAAAVTGLDLQTVINMTNLDLADSALHAPAAGFGDDDFYPDFVDKAAVLIVRLARNHPLPDGNKRAAWVSLRLFVDINGWAWDPQPSVDDVEAAVLAVAGGDWDEIATGAWLRKHLRPLVPTE
ncbi:MAG: Fic family protein [Actinomycetes bacterium]